MATPRLNKVYVVSNHKSVFVSSKSSPYVW